MSKFERVQARVWSKKWGCPQRKLCGKRVYVSCLEDQESGSIQMKAKRKYESGYKETVKKASLRFRTVKLDVVGGMLDKRLYGLLTSG